MKNRICLFIFISFALITQSLGQIPYYDALALKKLNPELVSSGIVIFPIRIHVEAAVILKKYTIKTTYGGIQEDFQNNPFINLPSIQSMSSNPISSLPNVFGGNVGGLDVTNYVNALSSLMIERAKEELNVAFFNRFKQFAKEYPEFRILFPKSTDVLSSLVTYKYPEILPSIRTAFFEDLEKIPYNLDDLLELPRYRELLKNFPEIRIAIRSLKLIQELESGISNAADVIKEFSELKDWNDKTAPRNFKNAASGVKLGAIVSESLRNINNEDSLWVSPKQIKTMINDPITFQIYLGLIYQKVKKEDIIFYKKPANDTAPDNMIKFTDLLQNNKETIEIFRTKLQEFSGLSHKTQLAFKDLKTKIASVSKISNDDIYNYINVSTDVVDYAFSFVKIFDESLNSPAYLSIIGQSNNLYKDIYTKQYNKAVTDALDLITKISNLVNERKIDTTKYKNEPYYSSLDSKPEFKTIVDELVTDKIKKENLVKLEQGINGHSSDNPILESLIGKKKIEGLLDFIENVRPYALFMANIANAENAADVKNALDAAILPVGSSGIKKYSCFNISVQSYLGAYYSFTNFSDKNGTSWTDKFGVTAPIGVSFNIGLKKGGSLGIFTALIDIGAIVDYQLKNDSTVNSSGQTVSAIYKDYKIELGQIFSPGVFLHYGFPWNLPLSLGIGGQYGPGLSKIDSSGDPVVNNPQWRFVANITVDLPFFTLFNKSKK